MKGNLITIYMWPSWDDMQSDNNINTKHNLSKIPYNDTGRIQVVWQV